MSVYSVKNQVKEEVIFFILVFIYCGFLNNFKYKLTLIQDQQF